MSLKNKLIIFIILLFSSYIISNEIVYCNMGDTGLTKSDFSFVYIDYINEEEISNSFISIEEFPVGSGYYIFTLSNNTNSSYYFKATYNSTNCEYYFPIGSTASSIAWVGNISLTTSTNIWKKGDTKPDLILRVNKFSENPVGWTCKFALYNIKAKAYKIENANCSYTYEDNEDGTYNLVLTYNWLLSDLNMSDCSGASCDYYAEFTFSKSSSIYTFPTDNSLKVVVIRK